MNLTDLVILSIVLIYNSLFIFGISKTTQYEVDDKNNITDKMIFWRVRYWCVKHLTVNLTKPIMLCPPCMASFWGSIFYWCFFSFTLEHLCIYPFYLLILCGLNNGIQKHFN
jgi:hypothetical protein